MPVVISKGSARFLWTEPRFVIPVTIVVSVVVLLEGLVRLLVRFLIVIGLSRSKGLVLVVFLKLRIRLLTNVLLETVRPIKLR